MASIYKRAANKRNRNAKWIIEYIDENGKRRKKAGFTDRQATEELARKLETEVDRRRKGLIDPEQEKLSDYAMWPISDHLDQYLSFLESKGTGTTRIARVRGACRDALEAMNVKTIRDLDPARLAAHLNDLRDQGLGAEARNGRLQAVSGFTRWLVRVRRLPTDPFAAMRPANVRVDRRLERRALTDDEVLLLIEAAHRIGDRVTVPKRYRKNGELKTGTRTLFVPHRCELYLIAVNTGFRVSELRSLTPSSFHLTADPPHIVVEAAYSKRKRQDRQPIRSDLAAILKPWLRTFPDDRQIWPKLPANMAPVIRADLTEAGIPETDEAGHRVDFHALRHTFCTRLARSGIAPATAKELARHSTIELTMNRYAHVTLADQKEALEGLPELDSDAIERQQKAADLAARALQYEANRGNKRQK